MSKKHQLISISDVKAFGAFLHFTKDKEQRSFHAGDRFRAFLLMNVLCYLGTCCHVHYGSLSLSWIRESSTLEWSDRLQLLCFCCSMDSHMKELCFRLS